MKKTKNIACMHKWMQDTVMLGADYYETDAEITSLLAEGRVPVGIGENTKITYKFLKIWSITPDFLWDTG